MAKSFCSGCKHWVFINGCETSSGTGFHYCDIFDRYELRLRKLWCNGKNYE